MANHMQNHGKPQATYQKTNLKDHKHFFTPQKNTTPKPNPGSLFAKAPPNAGLAPGWRVLDEAVVAKDNAARVAPKSRPRERQSLREASVVQEGCKELSDLIFEVQESSSKRCFFIIDLQKWISTPLVLLVNHVPFVQS